MNKRTRICITFMLMVVVSAPLIPSYVVAWRQESSSSYTYPKFSTHIWLAYEAIQSSPTPSEFQFIDRVFESHMRDFWLGLEAPYNADTADLYGIANYIEEYGDINSLVLYLDAIGTTVVNNNLSVRAQEEYVKLTTELSKAEPDLALAAFYAGAMSHYVSQAGVWGAIWNPSTWGTVNTTAWTQFESKIENSLEAVDFIEGRSEWMSEEFDLSPFVPAINNASQATIKLAQQIHPVAQSLGNNFNNSLAISEWPSAYYDNVKDCLTYSVEAIYSALKSALQEVNWKTISIPDVSYSFNNETGHLDIPAFTVEYYDNSGVNVLTNAEATNASVRVVAYTEDDPDGLLTDAVNELEYNSGSQTWSYPDKLLKGTATKVEHEFYLVFGMDLAATTWSNVSTSRFYVDYYFINFTQISYDYSRQDRDLDITKVEANCTDLPEIGLVEEDEVNYATWHVYTKGIGAQYGGAFGIQAYDTEGTKLSGDLEYNATDKSWYKLDIDLYWVFTSTDQQYFVVIKLDLKHIPTGEIRNTSSGTQVFEPYSIGKGKKTFITADHQINITKPVLEYDEQARRISFYNITAHTVFNDIEIDYYQIYEKPINPTVFDRRAAKWKIFLYSDIGVGIPSNVRGELEWNISTETWYAEDIWVGSLPDNQYVVRCQFETLNLNASTSPFGPPSEPFEISRPLPIIYYILPEFFLAGFVVLFGWLAWYRPKKQKEEKEARRQARLEEIEEGEMPEYFE
ncbi:MAG: hypothetical protein U9O98_07685 [Asgard group archaeon]|nr:hypothetical protein [Asgard group archaeon]